MIGNYLWGRTLADYVKLYVCAGEFSQTELDALTDTYIEQSGKLLAASVDVVAHLGFELERSSVSAYSTKYVAKCSIDVEVIPVASGMITHCIIAAFIGGSIDRCIQLDVTEVQVSRTYVSVDDANGRITVQT